ncbi:MAG: LptE family protein [Bacteroidales bacterium]|nr:LptE family protein [Bacteroidales bacterium]MBN2748667.1 LptE family protein [Bacteroidales bacterium]
MTVASNNPLRFLLPLFFVALVAVPMQGCKVSYSFTGASISPEVKTVNVDYFQNLSSLVNPQLSGYLTEELKNRFVSQTSLNVVRADGDLQFSGQITGYSVTPIAIQSNEVAAQNRLTITVKVKFVNNKDPKQNYDKSFSRYADFESSQNFSSVESQLMPTIVGELVEDIFNNAVANW